MAHLRIQVAPCPKRKEWPDDPQWPEEIAVKPFVGEYLFSIDTGATGEIIRVTHSADRRGPFVKLHVK